MAQALARNDFVSGEVGKLLKNAPAFAQLSPDEQARLRQNMAQVSSFLAEDPRWMAAPSRGLDDPVDQLKQQLAKDPGLVGKDFKAGAMAEGIRGFGELVKKVDFPKFVSGLVQGVFRAVVDASIQQMQAYAELLAAVAKTVDEFARDNMTDGQVRDYIATHDAGAVTMELPNDGPARLRPAGDGNEAAQLGRKYGINSDLDLSNDDDEQKLVGAARLQLAQERQRLLAMMVLLGINRIVVTNGKINAKVLFDVQTSDQARRRYKASLHDSETFTHTDSFSVGGGLLGDIFGGPEGSVTDYYSHTTTVESSLDESSEAKAQAKATLSGEVNLAFKSETFPLERMVDVLGMQNINDKVAAAPAKPVKGGAPAPAIGPGASK